MSFLDLYPQRAKDLIDLINDYRIENGVRPLRIDENLMRVGQDYSELLDETGQFSHTADGRYPWDRIDQSGFEHEPSLTGSRVGNENLHYGYSSRDGYSSPEKALNGWINSNGHNRNMLDPDWDHIGVGYRDGIYTGVFGDGPDSGTSASIPAPTSGNQDPAEPEPAPPAQPEPPQPEPTPEPGPGSFSPSQPVSLISDEPVNVAKLEFRDVDDESGSRAEIVLEVLLEGDRLWRGQLNVPEPGANVTLRTSVGFDELRIRANESDVTGTVNIVSGEVDWIVA